MKVLAAGILYAVVTLAFWSAVVVINYGVFGGSTRPGTPRPSEAYTDATTAVVLVTSLVIYILIIAAIHRIVKRYVLSRRPPSE